MRIARWLCIAGVAAVSGAFCDMALTTGHPSAWFVSGLACGVACVMALVEFFE